VRTGCRAGRNDRGTAVGLIGCLPVPREQTWVEPLQVGRRQAAQELPGELECLFDVPALTALVDELVLEIVGEGEVTAVSLGERRLADDRDEPA
jgi:hypothetical protein